MIEWEMPDIGEEEIQAVVESMKGGYVGAKGPFVKEFEEKFASKLGARYAVAVANGTLGLLCSLLAIKETMRLSYIGVPTFTFIASANTAAQIGQIKLIDCEKDTWNISKESAPEGVDLLMTVDVGGLACDYDSLKNLHIPIIADSAESCGAMYKGHMIGTQADVHVFSLHRAKIITTGEGGMITTSNPDLNELIRSIANHGYEPNRKEWQYHHLIRALNFRMVNTQAAIGLVQLKKLDRYVKERRKKAQIYKDIISDLVLYQTEPEGCLHPYFFFGILIEKDNDKFCEEMLKRGIQTRTWTPVHKQTPYLHLDKGFENADWVSRRIVLLPIHNKLTEDETIFVAETAKKLLKEGD
jgi:perosamine synthetase